MVYKQKIYIKGYFYRKDKIKNNEFIEKKKFLNMSWYFYILAYLNYLILMRITCFKSIWEILSKR